MKKYLILILSVIISSCKQYYEPVIDSEATIVTIQGLLTNEKGNVSVTISKAVPFDTASSFVKDGNATVTVSDDSGRVYNLYNNGSGVYSNSNFAGETGHAYTLHIITQAGDEFVSSPETMPGVNTIDSIYGSHVTKDIIYESSSNGYLLTKKTGLEFYADLGSSDGELPRCRFESLITTLYYYTKRSAFGTTPVYVWFTTNPDIVPNVTSDKFSKTQNVVKEHSLCFFFDANMIGPNNYVTGWLYTLTKYSLNAKSRAYYQSLADKLEASDRLFDPLPSQLSSNISCVNNPDKKVIGFFEVSSKERKYYYCRIDKRFQPEEKDTFPGFSEEGQVEGTPPPFFYYGSP